MFEIGVISIVVLAVGYWVTLWLIGRHDDVLHGDFVHAEDGPETAAAPPFPAPPFPQRPPFPKKPTIVKPAPAERHPAVPPQPATPAEPSDTLQALLASIKRDLKDASQL
ncbi:MAG TPA: hypothetical protein VKU60_12875 [Chloroflexota bacterium]|nr:hypothetical protein [Chloroflexota bacterium]